MEVPCNGFTENVGDRYMYDFLVLEVKKLDVGILFS